MPVPTLLRGSITALLLIGIAGCQRDVKSAEATPASAEQPASPVTAATAIARDVPDYLDEIGHAMPVESVTLMPQVTGRIIAAHFTEGTDVKKGDLLFEIDPRPFQAQLAKDEATLVTNREVLAQAQREYQRVEALKGTPAVPQMEYDQKKSAVATATAQVKWAEAAVETSRLNLEYCSIRSPIDGRTGARLVDPGNIVKENEGSLVLIQSLTPIYADFTITEKDLPAVRRNMANGSLQTLVTAPRDVSATTQPAAQASAATQSTDSEAPRAGTLTFLDNRVLDGTGTVRLRATLPNTDRHFWPGQFLKVRLVLSMKKDAVLIPAAAIQIGQKGPFVYVVGNDSAAELRLITLGQNQGEFVAIDQGLSAGERVVVTGQLMIMPGAKVNVVGGDMPTTAPTITATDTAHSETEGSRS